MFVSSLIAVTAIAYGVGVAKLWRNAGVGLGVTRAQAMAFACGWLALVVALLSPLDELAETLFTAHMAQHELLMVVAAPLIALSSPLVAYLWALPRGGRRAVVTATRRRGAVMMWAAITAAPVVWLLHGLALWIWHMPALYDAAVENEAVHAVQHLCFFSTAALFWWGMSHGRYGRGGYGAAVVYVFATAVHSGVLGALLTFSPHVWYPLYERSASTSGLTPLEDQQLAGLLMWVPASLIFIAGGLYFFGAWLRESERRVRSVQATRTQSTGRTQRKASALVSSLALVSLTCAHAACSSDPHTQFARTVDRAASWSASVQFAAQTARAMEVPRTYLHDLLVTASKDVDSIARAVDDSREIDSASRARASEACRRLSALLRDADQNRRIPDERTLRDIELQLRASAQIARGAVAPRHSS